MPPKIAITTKKSQYVSINESAEQDQAGWTLENELMRAMEAFKVEKVVVFVPKPGMVYMTDAANYRAKCIVYMAHKNKTGDRVRCVGLQHFERRHFRVKL
ncbi:hypothetical protein [Xanthomonas phage JGB6]|nr:hypothetical protein [Xanthomonas phage JGB6]